jgi:hypothetical protein
MQGSVVAMMDIGKDLIPCARVLLIIHEKDMHNHSIYNLGLSICLGVEGHGFGELGVHVVPVNTNFDINHFNHTYKLIINIYTIFSTD